MGRSIRFEAEVAAGGWCVRYPWFQVCPPGCGHGAARNRRGKERRGTGHAGPGSEPGGPRPDEPAENGDFRVRNEAPQGQGDDPTSVRRSDEARPSGPPVPTRRPTRRSGASDDPQPSANAAIAPPDAKGATMNDEKGFHDLRDGGSRTDRADHGLGGGWLGTSGLGRAPQAPARWPRPRRARRIGIGRGHGRRCPTARGHSGGRRDNLHRDRAARDRSGRTARRGRAQPGDRPHRRNNEEAVARRPRSWPVRRRDVLDRTSERDRRRPIGRARRRAGDRDGRRRGGWRGRGRGDPANHHAATPLARRPWSRQGQAGRRRFGGRRGRGPRRRTGRSPPASARRGPLRAGRRPEGRPSHRRRPTNRGGPSPIPRGRRRRPPSPRSRTRPRPPRRPGSGGSGRAARPCVAGASRCRSCPASPTS